MKLRGRPVTATQGKVEEVGIDMIMMHCRYAWTFQRINIFIIERYSGDRAYGKIALAIKQLQGLWFLVLLNDASTPRKQRYEETKTTISWGWSMVWKEIFLGFLSLSEILCIHTEWGHSDEVTAHDAKVVMKDLVRQQSLRNWDWRTNNSPPQPWGCPGRLTVSSLWQLGLPRETTLTAHSLWP